MTPSIESTIDLGPGFELIKVSQTEDGNRWQIDIGIRRMWPIYWIVDHRPWENFARRKFPVQTFVGKGMNWHRVSDKGNHHTEYTHLLNAIISQFTLLTETD